MDTFEPKIVGFLCHWCAYEGADSAGRARRIYPYNLSIVRVVCCGRVDPQFILEAFKEGADGVVILGCHPGDCHYKGGNYRALSRYLILRKIISQFGIEEERLHLDWISAKETDKFVRVISKMVNIVKGLGPLSLNAKNSNDK